MTIAGMPLAPNPTASQGGRTLSLGLVALLMSLAVSASAQVVASHEKDADPAGEGWSAVGAAVGVTAGPVVADLGFDVWSIDDASAVAGSSLRYEVSPTAAQVADGNARGWQLTVRLRVPTFPDPIDAGRSIIVGYGDGDARWEMRFFADAAGIPTVVLTDDVALESSHTPGVDGYHDYQLLYSPFTGSALLFVDGVLAATGYDGVPSVALASVGFGSDDLVDVGHAYYETVLFAVKLGPAACNNGVDDDSDGLVDYPADPGCKDALSEFEETECDDALDNDGDGNFDWDGAGLGPADPKCPDGHSLRESVVNALWCGSPEGEISLLPTPTLLRVNGTCNYQMELIEEVDGQASVEAHNWSEPETDGLETRHDHKIEFGLLAPDDALTTEWSPILWLLDVPASAGPTERISLWSRLARVGDNGSFTAEARVQGGGFDQTCVFPVGVSSCDLDVPEGTVISIEPRLETGQYHSASRSQLAVTVGHVPRCRDGIDNDGDTLVDYPADPECLSPDDLEETDNQCTDGIDNDGDGGADHPIDPGCLDAADPDETDPSLICDDGIDNDGDTLVDFPNDPHCASSTDVSENPACSDGLDNDNDGNADFPADLGCAGVVDDDERGAPFACDDGLDNDSNGKIDYPSDPGCASPVDANEASAACTFGCGTISCGLGVEIAPVLLLLGWARRRATRSPV